jgi:hypothetical protein
VPAPGRRPVPPVHVPLPPLRAPRCAAALLRAATVHGHQKSATRKIEQRKKCPRIGRRGVSIEEPGRGTHHGARRCCGRRTRKTREADQGIAVSVHLCLRGEGGLWLYLKVWRRGTGGGSRPVAGAARGVKGRGEGHHIAHRPARRTGTEGLAAERDATQRGPALGRGRHPQDAR